jgi:hypothetical protein
MGQYAFMFRFGVFICLVLSSALMAGWKWGPVSH